MRPINHYFGPYGTLGKLRGHNLRSFFERVKSPFDLPDDERTKTSLQPFVSESGQYECAYCSANAEEWDHIIEASDGGSHQLGNLLPACRSCNRRRRPWLDQLKKVGGADFQMRKVRIERYIDVLQKPGHTIFDDADLARLELAQERLFAAIKEVDEVIGAATAKFRSKHSE